MITMLIYGCEGDEGKLVGKLCSDIIAFAGNEKLNTVYSIDENMRPDMAIINICGVDGLNRAHDVRGAYPNTEIMLIADTSVSPMKYLNPVLRPISLLVRPFENKELREVLTEFIGQMDSLNERRREDTGFLKLDTVKGSVEVSVDDVLYIEASNKMLNVRLDSVEYCIAGSLENYEKLLEKTFVRCHRSYIVNRRFVGKVRFSENYIKLTNGDTVPLSRSCKQNFKEASR